MYRDANHFTLLRDFYNGSNWPSICLICHGGYLSVHPKIESFKTRLQRPSLPLYPITNSSSCCRSTCAARQPTSTVVIFLSNICAGTGSSGVFGEVPRRGLCRVWSVWSILKRLPISANRHASGRPTDVPSACLTLADGDELWQRTALPPSRMHGQRHPPWMMYWPLNYRRRWRPVSVT